MPNKYKNKEINSNHPIPNSLIYPFILIAIGAD
jgi:hypothetical protein